MGTRYVVHRGGAARWPENSLLAFRSAIAHGATLLELDVHASADGEVVVIHDPTLDRTTDATGPVAARTAADLRRVRLRAVGAGFSEEWVPTLDEVLAIAVPAGATLLVEIKGPGPAVAFERTGGAVRAVPGARYEGLEARVLATLDRAGMPDRALVMAFNPAVLAEVRRLAPRQRTALLVDRHHVERAGIEPAETVEWARAAGVAVLGLHHTLCERSVLAAARRAGLAVGVFTVNDETEMRRLAELGVDVIITDRPDLVPRMQGGAP